MPADRADRPADGRRFIGYWQCTGETNRLALAMNNPRRATWVFFNSAGDQFAVTVVSHVQMFQIRPLETGACCARVRLDTDGTHEGGTTMNPTLAILIPKCCCKKEPCCCQDDCNCCKA